MINSKLISLCFLGAPVLTSLISCNKVSQKPNVLLILADALGCLGNRIMNTPNSYRCQPEYTLKKYFVINMD